MKASLCISVGPNDTGLDRLIASLDAQNPKPHQILTESFGTVPESRNKMFNESTGDILVFIDTDQEVPENWLDVLTAPIAAGTADYACGPTKPHPNPLHVSNYDAYFEALEKQLYFNICAHDQTAFPMGNSAWSRPLFEQLLKNDGHLFDERFRWGGEDYDINIRATNAGFAGVFVPGAWVWHDQSNLNSAYTIIKRKFKYCKGGAMANLKNNTLGTRARRSLPPFKKYRHWIELFQPAAQAVGFIRGWREVSRWNQK